jgi:hypothetical protein
MSLALRPTLALVLASFGALSPLRAQEVSVAPNSEIARCVSWMNATVPAKVDPADFCAGIKRGNSDGWWAVFKCGRTGQQIAGSPIKYCTSSGHITERETWGAGFRSTTRDGHEFFDGTAEAGKDTHPVAATFYSSTALSMGSLRLAPGMYDLMPSKSPEGWKLEVAKWSDGPNTQSYLGSVEMKGVAEDNLDKKSNLTISMRSWADGCSALSPDRDLRELHFIYGSTDLFVCIRPDQRPIPQAEISAQK